MVNKLYDSLLESLESGEITALIQTDQSKAYDVVDHQILVKKMQWLGFNNQAIKIISSYLSQRRQYVVVDSYPSDPLIVGPRSITQGSSLSCLLYIIYILDITSIYHASSHTPEETIKCSNEPDNGVKPEGIKCNSTSAKSFVDDNIIHTKAKHGLSIQQAVLAAIAKLEDYTNANHLALNPEKLRVMVLAKDTKIQKYFKVTIGGKELVHQPALTILGNVVAADLSWDKHVKSIVIPALANRARTLQAVSSFMDTRFRKTYASAIFRGKLSSAADGVGRCITVFTHQSTADTRQSSQSSMWTLGRKALQTSASLQAWLAQRQG